MFKFLKSLFWQIINSILKINLEIFVFNRRVRRILKGDFAKFYLRKYIVWAVKQPDEQNQINEPYRIWQYWEQGLENAPEIVKACLDSVEKYNPGIERIIISPQNIREYVDIPEYIYKLKEKGVIKLAHFSDILRTYLLLQHGGCWIDATVLMTAPLPDYIKTADLFVFQSDEKADLDGLNMASYFISSGSRNIGIGVNEGVNGEHPATEPKNCNRILQDVKNTLEKYWKENNFLVNYFTFLHAFTMVTKYNKDIWSKVPFFSFIPVQQMQAELVKPYSKERFEQLKSMTPIHKLTYKPKVMTKEKNVNLEGTLYEAIIEGKIYD